LSYSSKLNDLTRN